MQQLYRSDPCPPAGGSPISTELQLAAVAWKRLDGHVPIARIALEGLRDLPHGHLLLPKSIASHHHRPAVDKPQLHMGKNQLMIPYDFLDSIWGCIWYIPAMVLFHMPPDHWECGKNIVGTAGYSWILFQGVKSASKHVRNILPKKALVQDSCRLETNFQACLHWGSVLQLPYTNQEPSLLSVTFWILPFLPGFSAIHSCRKTRTPAGPSNFSEVRVSKSVQAFNLGI